MIGRNGPAALLSELAHSQHCHCDSQQSCVSMSDWLVAKLGLAQS